MEITPPFLCEPHIVGQRAEGRSPAPPLPEWLLREHDLIGERAVTQEQADKNRAEGRSPIRPREGRPRLIPISKATLWRKVRTGEFPAPVRIGGVTAWRASDVAAWIEAQK